MTEHDAPIEIRRLADQRRAARAERNWAEADHLKAEIEAAGWKIIDQGRAFSLSRAHPPDVEDDGVVRYGWSGSVPSVLGEPASAAATVVRAVPDDAMSVAEVVAAPGDTQVVLVANRPAATMPSGDPEVVLLNGWPGAANALNAGIRRARGAVVVLARADQPVTAGDLERLTAALADPTVAVAGPHGWTSDDLRLFDPAPAGDAVAINGRLIAFRRADYVARGPLDEAFVDPFRLDVWWSLTLRDEGPDEPPRRAVVLEGAPASRRGGDGGEAAADDAPVAPEDPAQRRNFYRVVRQFGGAGHLTQERSADA
jgi:hypothetical protein